MNQPTFSDVIEPGLASALATMREEAINADAMALLACERSKYSVQDYWMCVEFVLQRLHDRIAREHGLSARCPIGPFRAKLNEFRKSVTTSNTSGLYPL